VEEILLFNKFFFQLLIDAVAYAKIGHIARQKLCDGAQTGIWGDFLGPAFPASPVQHISDLHSKFALRPHHVYRSSLW